MKISQLPVNHSDERGIIRDIFAHGAPECVTLITSKKGAVRGNHVHRRSTQHVYIVSGRLCAYTTGYVLGPRDDQPAREIVRRCTLYPGDLATHEPGEKHAYVADEDTVFLAFAEGLRKGEDYELDTERVPSLVERFALQPADP